MHTCEQPHSETQQLELVLHPSFAALDQVAQTLPAERTIDATFVHRAMCLASLPVKQPQDPTVAKFARTYPGMPCTLSINTQEFIHPETGALIPIGVPYGPQPRLFICWMIKMARETGSRELDVGSIKPWLKSIGISTGGGYRQSQRQLLKLARTTFYADMLIGRGPNRKVAFKQKPLLEETVFTEEDYIAFSSGDMTGVHWPQQIILSETAFRDFLSEDTIPVPMKCLSEIADSATAIDIFCYLCYRLPLIPKGQREHFSYKQMSAQFGSKVYAHNSGIYRRNVQDAIDRAIAQLPYHKEIVEHGDDARGQPGLWLRHSDLSRFHETFVTTVSASSRASLRWKRRLPIEDLNDLTN